MSFGLASGPSLSLARAASSPKVATSPRYSNSRRTPVFKKILIGGGLTSRCRRLSDANPNRNPCDAEFRLKAFRDLIVLLDDFWLGVAPWMCSLF
jgi:hypothetical protein